MAFSKNKKFRLATSVIIFLIATGFIIFGVWGLMQRRQTTSNPNPVIRTDTITHSTDTPDETPPLCDDSYQVSASYPRQIEVPSQNISGCIQPVGVDQHGAIAVPTNVHLAGWFVDSPLPGGQGVSIIDGHVSGRYTDAIFDNLEHVENGNIIRLQFGDLSWKEFEVVEIISLDIDEATKQMFGQVADVHSQLTLITCAGSFDHQSQSYDKRIMIRSKLI